jgi:hypothetical protein
MKLYRLTPGSVIQIRFNGTKPSDLLIERNMLGDFAVQVTGNHYIVVANCDPRIQTLTVKYTSFRMLSWIYLCVV